MRHLESVQLVDMVPSTSPAGCAEEHRIANLPKQTTVPSADIAKDAKHGGANSLALRTVRSLMAKFRSGR